MKWLTTVLGMVGISFLAPHVAPVQAAAAQIKTIAPSTARPGEIVTITGNGFGAQDVKITVGGVPAVVVWANGSSVAFVVPTRAAIGQSTVTAANPGGQQGSIAFRVLLGFSVDAAASVQRSIGLEGGVLTTQSGGTTYQLIVPPATLDQNTTITLAPASFANLPFSGGVAAGAQFEPSGLVLHREGTLIISRPGGFPQGLLGFVVDNQGANLELVSVGNGASQLTIPINHFSGGGGGAPAVTPPPTAQDFERLVLPLLNSLPPNLPTTQVATLMGDLAAWFSTYGLAICTQTVLCDRVFTIGIQSLALNESQACSQADAFIQQGEPFLAERALADAAHVAVRLFEVSNLADLSGVSGFSQPFDTSCIVADLGRIVDLARAKAQATPTAGLLLLIDDISSTAATMEELALEQHAFSALDVAVHATLTLARQLCSIDPPAGEMLLDNVILNTFPDGFLNGLEAGLSQVVHDARAGCRVQVQPLTTTVHFGKTAQFTATTSGLAPAGVTWSLEGAALGGTIDPQSGLFTAGQISGTVIVRAQSVADVSLFTRATVTQVPDVHVSLSPPSATVLAGGTVSFSAQVTGGGPQVTWTATGGSIPHGPSASATFTAGSTPGTFSVTATSVTDPSASTSASVLVTAPGTLSGRIVRTVHSSDTTVAGGIAFTAVSDISMDAFVTVKVAADGTVAVISATGSYTQSATADSPCFDPGLPPLIIGNVEFSFNSKVSLNDVEGGTITAGSFTGNVNDPFSKLTLFVGALAVDSDSPGPGCTASAIVTSFPNHLVFGAHGTPTFQGGHVVSLDFSLTDVISVITGVLK